MATYHVQKSRSTLPSFVQPILTSALTHYQNNFRKLNVNQNAFFDEISEHARLLQHARLLRHANHFRNTYLKPGFQGHEQRGRLIEMENNSNFSHIRTYVRVLHRDDDYLDHAVMQVHVSLYIVSSPLSMQ